MNINNTNISEQTQDKWVEVTVKKSRCKTVKEAEMQQEKQRQGKRGMMEKKDNRYQDLKDIEEVEGNNLDEEFRTETKNKEVGDLEDETVLHETMPSTREKMNENVKHDCNEE